MTPQDERNAKRIIREKLIDQRRGADPERFNAIFAQIKHEARYGNPARKSDRAPAPWERNQNDNQN